MPRRRIIARITTFALLAAAAAGCHSRIDRATPTNGGTLVIGMTSDPGPLVPPISSSQLLTEVADQLFDPLAERSPGGSTIGDAGFQPRLAESWSWSADSLAIAFHLNPRARWHDGVPVRASDVRFSFQVYRDTMAGSVFAAALARIDSVTVRDSLTPVFHFSLRYPHQFYDAATDMLILPEHVLGSIAPVTWRSSEFANHPVGSGRFRLVTRTPLTLRADTLNYRGRPHIGTLIFLVEPDIARLAQRFLNGEMDFAPHLSTADVAEAPRHPRVRLVEWPAGSVGYLLFNCHNPILADRAVRLALSMGVDRRHDVTMVFDTLARLGIGPIPRSEPFADTTVRLPAYDLAAARRLLDGAGWVIAGPDSIRFKHGRPLRFTISVPTTSAERQRLAELLREDFRKLGATVEIETLDFNTYLTTVTAGQFDATIYRISFDAFASSLAGWWGRHGSPITGGRNFGAYDNAAFDALVDSANNTSDTAATRRLIRQAVQTLVSDAPAVWIYESRNIGGIDRRVRPVLARGERWFADLGDWWIDRNDALARDGPRTSRPH